jgi:hypothetical protein
MNGMFWALWAVKNPKGRKIVRTMWTTWNLPFGEKVRQVLWVNQIIGLQTVLKIITHGCVPHP